LKGLASIGFARIYDYVAGKADWGSAGLPLEGRSGSPSRVGAYVRTEVPTCSLDDDLSEVRDRVRDAGWDTCFVVDDDRVVPSDPIAGARRSLGDLTRSRSCDRLQAHPPKAYLQAFSSQALGHDWATSSLSSA
jgi:hypothetical protein